MLDILTDQLRQREKIRVATNTKDLKSKKQSASTSATQLSFKTSILEGVSEEFNNQIESFVTELDTLQQELIKQPSIELMEKYRLKVGTFLKELFSHYQSHSFFRGKLGQRVEIKVWHSIDQELDSLSRAIVENNAQGLNLLHHFGALRGILLDLRVGK